MGGIKARVMFLYRSHSLMDKRKSEKILTHRGGISFCSSEGRSGILLSFYTQVWLGIYHWVFHSVKLYITWYNTYRPSEWTCASFSVSSLNRSGHDFSACPLHEAEIQCDYPSITDHTCSHIFIHNRGNYCYYSSL